MADNGAPAVAKGSLAGESAAGVAEAFMQSAAASALAGVRLEHGGPFGAAIVRDGVIVACAHNSVLHSGDPACHAEMNAIRQACQALGSHDLSDCDLYTTCEPCPMCWGATQWSRLGRVHIGVDRHTAAKYGFDDKVFYDEVDNKSGCYGLRCTGYCSESQSAATMVEVYDGLLDSDVQERLFANPNVNRTARRRFAGGDGEKVKDAYAEVFVREADTCPNPLLRCNTNVNKHETFMHLAIEAAARGARQGNSKERECFGAVIVRDGKVLAEAYNTVLGSRDATATAEVNAIRAAAERLGSHNLEGCEMYCTTHPDLMSLGAILWARISRVFCGVTQQVAARSGFEEGIAHFKDLLEGRRHTDIVEGVAKEECEAVFREWSNRNGVIY